MKKTIVQTWLAASLAIALIIITSCDSEKAKSDRFSVKGELANTEGQMLYLEELGVNGTSVIDSIKIDENGKFLFVNHIETDGFYMIKVASNNFVTLLVAPGENIEISGDIKNLALSYEVKGSEGSVLISELNTKLYSNLSRVDSLRQVFTQVQYEPDFAQKKQELDIIYNEIYDNQRDYVRSFIKENSSSLASLMAIYQNFGREKLISESEDFEYFEILDKGLFEAMPKNIHAIDLHKRITELKRLQTEQKLQKKRLAPGIMAPEINLENPEGKKIALSSLKGKVVLVDFWASWCGPCRKENPHLKKIYNKYKNKGFEIYGVALEKDKSRWLKAIKQDGLPWIQVSDLMYWNSPAAQLYNISSIPYSYLLDREGKIIAKGMRSAELEAKLKEIL